MADSTGKIAIWFGERVIAEYFLGILNSRWITPSDVRVSRTFELLAVLKNLSDGEYFVRVLKEAARKKPQDVRHWAALCVCLRGLSRFGSSDVERADASQALREAKDCLRALRPRVSEDELERFLVACEASQTHTLDPEAWASR